MSRYDHPAWGAYQRKVLLELDPDLHDNPGSTVIDVYEMQYRTHNGWRSLATTASEQEAISTLRHWARRGYPVRWTKNLQRRPLPRDVEAMYPPPAKSVFLVERKLAGRWYPVGKADNFRAAGEILRHYMVRGDQVRWSKNGKELPIQGAR